MSAPFIGAMRLRMTLEAPIDALDDAGAVLRNYAPLGDVWAEVVPVSAEERFVAQRQEQAITHVARIRWRANVTSQMRLASGARKLIIRSVYDPDGRRRFLFCRCEEISL